MSSLSTNQVPASNRAAPPGDATARGWAGSVPIVVVARLVWRCIFPWMAVLIGSVVLTAVPQAREALMVFAADATTRTLHAAFFVLSVTYWAVASWFTCRLLLGRRLACDSLGARPDDPFVDWLATILPWVLALTATLPVTMLTWQANRALGAWVLAASATFFFVVVLRRRFGGIDGDAHRSYAEFVRLTPADRQTALWLLAFGAALFASAWSLGLGMVVSALWALGSVQLVRQDQAVCRDRRASSRSQAPPGPRGLLEDLGVSDWLAFAVNLGSALLMLYLGTVPDDEIDLARRIGSPALLLCALAAWTTFGGLALTYLPLTRWGVNLAAVVPPLLLLLGSPFQTHWVAQRGPLPDADWRAGRPGLVAHFVQWMSAHEPGAPVFMVAVAGGASRAAYWSGSVLARLQDEAEAQGHAFAANVYALSTISGGSLGAAAWVADLAQYPERRPCRTGDRDGCRRHRVEQFVGQDFLSPVLARTLGPDLMTRFLPLPVPQAWSDRADRSLGLEQAWVQDWRRLRGPGAGPAAVDWARPITALYAPTDPPRRSALPTLLLNTVRIDDGQRFVQSNVRVDLPGVLDMFDPAIDTQRLTLAQAVHNSARFPYVSPAAALRAAAEPRPVVGRLGDGGYHENSGAATLADLLERLRDEGLLRAPGAGKGLWACAGGWTAPRAGPPADAASWPACRTQPSPVVALVLDSGPADYPRDFVRDREGVALPERPADTHAGMPLPELLGPVFGGLSTRSQLGRASQQRLSRLVGDDPRAFIELRMPAWRTTVDDRNLVTEPGRAARCEGHRRQPSMNWSLDPCSQARLSAAAAPGVGFAPHPSLAQVAFVHHLGRLRRLVGEGTAGFGGAAP